MLISYVIIKNNQIDAYNDHTIGKCILYKNKAHQLFMHHINTYTFYIPVIDR